MTNLFAFAAGSLLWALQAASALPPEPQDLDRPTVSLDDFKGLRENNIFAPSKPARQESSRRHDSNGATPPSKPKTPVVTGIVYDAKGREFRVLAEDRNSDAKLVVFTQPRFLKVGEEFLGYRIESVNQETVTVKAGETTAEIRAGDSFPEFDGWNLEKTAGEKAAALPAEKVDPPAPPLDEAARSMILEKLKGKLKKNRKESDFEEP